MNSFEDQLFSALERYDRNMMDDPNLTPEDFGKRPERMLVHFRYDHLNPDLREVSKPFCELAFKVVSTIEPGPERTVALRKLLEAKDAAVRAKVNPGG